MPRIVKKTKAIMKRRYDVIVFAIFILSFALYFVLPRMMAVSYDSKNADSKKIVENPASVVSGPKVKPENLTEAENNVIVTHVKVPNQVKGIYMTSWVGGTKSIRDNLVKIIDETEINSVVIDIKDYTGYVAFDVPESSLMNMGGEEVRIADIRQFIDTLHKKGVYVIGRISSFQDPQVVKHRPDLAVKRASDGGVWKDRKGITWIDAGSKEMWDYLVSLAKVSYDTGFDEINFDYIRFPSDGDMKDIRYPFSQGKVKSLVIRDFFKYLRDNLGDTGMVLSADLFGMTTTNTDDLNIGQVLEYSLQYMDYVAPMVYPSHYPTGFNGYKNPNALPYEIIKFSMGRAAERAVATSSIFMLEGSTVIPRSASSTSPQLYTKESWNKQKLRPWLQDFSLGTPAYGAPEVRAQIKATYDVGLNSWLLWSASNKYTLGALNRE